MMATDDSQQLGEGQSMSEVGTATAHEAARATKEPSPQAQPQAEQAGPSLSPNIATILASAGGVGTNPGQHHVALLRARGSGRGIGALEAGYVLQLQRIHGNRHLARLLEATPRTPAPSAAMLYRASALEAGATLDDGGKDGDLAARRRIALVVDPASAAVDGPASAAPESDGAQATDPDTVTSDAPPPRAEVGEQTGGVLQRQAAPSAQPGLFGSLAAGAQSLGSSVLGALAGLSPDVLNGIRALGPGALETLKKLGSVALTWAPRLLNFVQASPQALAADLAGVWRSFPHEIKKLAVNKVLQAGEFIVSRTRAIAQPVAGVIGPLISEFLLGFIRRMRQENDKDLLVAKIDRMALLIGGGSLTFTLHFLKGLALGVWDVIKMPYDLLMAVVSGLKFGAQVIQNLSKQAIEDGRKLLETAMSAAWNAVVEMVTDPSKATKFVDTIWASVQKAAGQMGRGLAQAALDLDKLPDDKLGEEAGKITAGIVIDVILAALTTGIAAALRRGIAAVAEVSRLARRAIRAMGAFVKAVRSVIAPLIEGIHKLIQLFAKSRFGQWLTRFANWLDHLGTAVQAAVMANELMEAGAEEALGEGVEEVEFDLEEVELRLAPEPVPAGAMVGRIAIQRATSPPASGKAFEDYVRGLIRQGKLSAHGVPSMEHIIRGEFNKKGHGIDFFGFRQVGDRLHLYRIEVKGKGSEVKKTKQGLQTGLNWTDYAIDGALENPALRARLERVTGLKGGELRARLKKGRGILISKRGFSIKGLKGLGRLRKKGRPKLIKF